MYKEEIAHFRDTNGSSSRGKRPITDQELLAAHNKHDVVSNDKGSLGIICKVEFNADQYESMRISYAVNWMVKKNDEPYAWFRHDDLISKGNVMSYYQHVHGPF